MHHDYSLFHSRACTVLIRKSDRNVVRPSIALFSCWAVKREEKILIVKFQPVFAEFCCDRAYCVPVWIVNKWQIPLEKLSASQNLSF
jgi:hypothetical protein